MSLFEYSFEYLFISAVHILSAAARRVLSLGGANQMPAARPAHVLINLALRRNATDAIGFSVLR
jgi:hypothetical protein